MTTIKYHTKEAALTAVKKDGTELQFCSSEMKGDEDVVVTAIKNNFWSFKYASNELQSSKPFILKSINDDVEPWYLIHHSEVHIHSDIEVMSLALEKSNDGWDFQYAKGEVALNKELAAKALVKWGAKWESDDVSLWRKLHPTIQEFFPKESWYKKAQAYLIQLEQEKQAELVSGGSTTEDEVVW